MLDSINPRKMWVIWQYSIGLLGKIAIFTVLNTQTPRKMIKDSYTAMDIEVIGQYGTLTSSILA